MEIRDALTILAILVGPILAVWVSLWREAYGRRRAVFRGVLLSRRTPMSMDRVNSLNSIELEFYKYEKVREAWRLYFNHLCTDPKATGWDNREKDLLIGLLKEMASALWLKFDESDLRRLDYLPQGHTDFEQTQKRITAGLAQVLEAKTPLWVVTNPPPPTATAPPAAAPAEARPTSER